MKAQTGIGTTTPDASAKLDVSATNKGFLPPRVTLTSGTDNTTIPSPATGLLVYNTGNNAGLVAGYYYWNGSSWATIATASGYSVGSSYLRGSRSAAQTTGITTGGTIVFTQTDNVSGQEITLNTSTGQITLAAGRTYRLIAQVPNFQTSNSDARPQFSWYNETASTYIGSASSAYSAASSAGYGTTGGLSEVIITTTGTTVVSFRIVNTFNINQLGGNADFTTAGSYPWFEAQVISGNAPVNGQSVDYVSVGSISTTGVGGSQDLIFPTNYGGNIPYNTSTGVFTLSANKTYLFQAQVRVNNPSAGGNYIEYAFVDAVSNTLLVNGTQTITSSSTSTAGYGSNPVINFIYTPTSNQTVKIRTTSNTVGTQTVTSGTANITQIGSSAIVNPWTLSGTNTYNTTGNVGIGTTSPATTLTVGNTAGTIGGEILLNPTSTQYEGGQIVFKRSLVGSTVDWTLDQYGTTSSNARFRIFNGSSETNGIAILENGYLGIGTATPSNKLHVQSSDGNTVYIESTTADNNGMMILNANTNQNWSSNWHEFIYFRNQGNNIGSIIGSNGGNMVSFNTSSDYRLKTDFKGYNGLDLVNKIKTYDYAWKRDSSRMYGFVAHELQEVIPYLVSGTKDAVDANGKIIPQSVDYSKLTPILVKAIQEQDVKIKKQEGDIKKLSDDNRALEQRIINLEKIIKKYINHN